LLHLLLHHHWVHLLLLHHWLHTRVCVKIESLIGSKSACPHWNTTSHHYPSLCWKLLLNRVSTSTHHHLLRNHPSHKPIIAHWLLTHEGIHHLLRSGGSSHETLATSHHHGVHAAKGIGLESALL
jgi:hypothetical protein